MQMKILMDSLLHLDEWGSEDDYWQAWRCKAMTVPFGGVYWDGGAGKLALGTDALVVDMQTGWCLWVAKVTGVQQVD